MNNDCIVYFSFYVVKCVWKIFVLRLSPDPLDCDFGCAILALYERNGWFDAPEAYTHRTDPKRLR